MIARNTKQDNIHEEISQKLITKLNQYPDITGIELIALYTFILQNKFNTYLYSVTPSSDTIFKEGSVEYNDWHQKLNETLVSEKVSFLESFAISKYCLEHIFFDLTERGQLEYTYSNQALITSKELQLELNVSRSTISRYVDAGMDSRPGNGHRSYPKHNIFYWSQNEWATKVQRLYQSFKMRNRTEQDLIKEIKEKIKEFEEKYNYQPFSAVFANVKDPYELDEPDDYYDWKDLIDELEELNE